MSRQKIDKIRGAVEPGVIPKFIRMGGRLAGWEKLRGQWVALSDDWIGCLSLSVSCSDALYLPLPRAMLRFGLGDSLSRWKATLFVTLGLLIEASQQRAARNSQMQGVLPLFVRQPRMPPDCTRYWFSSPTSNFSVCSCRTAGCYGKAIFTLGHA